MTWNLDPHHTSVAFSAKHMGVATVRGRFDQVAADLQLDDPSDPTTGSRHRHHQGREHQHRLRDA